MTASPPTSFGKSIPHIEDLSPGRLVEFVCTQSKRNIKVSEKFDGSFVTFGNDEDGFYLSTKKGTKWRSATDIPDVYYMAEFKRVVPYLREAVRKYGNVEIKGELIPCHDHTIVMYDEDKVMDGVFVILSLKTEQGDVTSEWGLAQHVDFMRRKLEARNLGGYFYFKTVDSKAFPRKLVRAKRVLEIAEFYQRHQEFLAKPARDEGSKSLKAAILGTFKQFAMEVKEDCLFALESLPGTLGNEVEGWVLTMPDGTMLKVVDKEKFTKRLAENWFVLGHYKQAEKLFKRKCEETPDMFDAHLVEFKESATNVVFNGTFTITKKEQETKQHQKMLLDKINRLLVLQVQGLTPAQLSMKVVKGNY